MESIECFVYVNRVSHKLKGYLFLASSLLVKVVIYNDGKKCAVLANEILSLLPLPPYNN